MWVTRRYASGLGYTDREIDRLPRFMVHAPNEKKWVAHLVPDRDATPLTERMKSLLWDTVVSALSEREQALETFGPTHKAGRYKRELDEALEVIEWLRSIGADEAVE